jgi:hypothetical protein
MLIIPLRPTPSQTLTIPLAGQNCRINVYQREHGLYLDLIVPTLKAEPLVAGVACRNNNRIVRYAYLGFVGDLKFFDELGQSDPSYAGLGGRYQLVYLEAADLAGGA